MALHGQNQCHDYPDELVLVTPLVNATITPGSNVIFSCIFNKNVPVVWLRDDQSLNIEMSKYSLSEPGLRRLSITNATYAEMGIYTCQASDVDTGRVIRTSAILSLTPRKCSRTLWSVTNTELTISCCHVTTIGPHRPYPNTPTPL